MPIINRLVFKTDDHLRNHGLVLVHHDFILVLNKGGRLSDAYELNLVVDSRGMKPNTVARRCCTISGGPSGVRCSSNSDRDASHMCAVCCPHHDLDTLIKRHQCLHQAFE